ncbi:MAG TPA: hypothetical protein VFE85_08905, partial [Woeseiaceae bacterium]|nr:hypothetical protein [Woeseiaceae bacterium]
FLSIAGLAGVGRDYAARYWQATVGSTGATRVYPIHYEDFTRPYGEIALFPDILDDVVTSTNWLREFAAAQELPVSVMLPRYGMPIVLY